MKKIVLLAVGTLFFITLASWSAVIINNGDVFMYMAMARYFLKNAFYFANDPFLFLNNVFEPHFHHQWLAYFYFFFFNQYWGLTGLIFSKIFLIVVIFVVPVWFAKSINKLSISTFGLLALALIVMAARIGERAFLFSDLFTVLVLSILLIFDQTRKQKVLFLLPPIFLAWIQLHPGFPIGLMFVSLYLLLRYSVASRTEQKIILSCTIMSYLICIVNPLGVAGFLYPFKIFFSSEWDIYRQINSEWVPLFSSTSIPLESKIVFVIIFSMALISSIRQALSKNIFPISIALAMGYLTWSSMRFTSMSPLVLSILLIATSQPLQTERKAIAAFSIFVVLLLGGYVYHFDNQGISYLFSDKPKANYPMKAFETLANLPPATVFAEWDWNSVICWVVNGRHKVVVHGHIDRPAFAVQNFLSINRSPEDFDRIVETNQVKYFLLAPETISDSSSILAKRLSNPPWTRIYQDSQAILFSR